MKKFNKFMEKFFPKTWIYSRKELEEMYQIERERKKNIKFTLVFGYGFSEPKFYREDEEFILPKINLARLTFERKEDLEEVKKSLNSIEF